MKSEKKKGNNITLNSNIRKVLKLTIIMLLLIWIIFSMYALYYPWESFSQKFWRITLSLTNNVTWYWTMENDSWIYLWFIKDWKYNWYWKLTNLSWDILEWNWLNWLLNWTWIVKYSDWNEYEWNFIDGKRSLWIYKYSRWYYSWSRLNGTRDWYWVLSIWDWLIIMKWTFKNWEIRNWIAKGLDEYVIYVEWKWTTINNLNDNSNNNQADFSLLKWWAWWNWWVNINLKSNLWKRFDDIMYNNINLNWKTYWNTTTINGNIWNQKVNIQYHDYNQVYDTTPIKIKWVFAN